MCIGLGHSNRGQEPRKAYIAIIIKIIIIFGHKLDKIHDTLFGIRTAAGKRISIFCDTMQCSPLKVKRRFGGIYHLLLQGRVVS
jgi:hypothetical protein